VVGIGIHDGFKIRCLSWACGFDSHHRYSPLTEREVLFRDTFTKTIGNSADSFGILQIALDLRSKPWYNAGVKTEFVTDLAVLMTFLKVSSTGPTQTVTQEVSCNDLRNLADLFYSAAYTYETRQKEIENRTDQAQDETSA
jgi:hypothetical protein